MTLSYRLINWCSNALYRIVSLTQPTCKGLFLIFLLLVLFILLLAEIWLLMTVKWRGRPSGEGYGCDERCGSPIAGAPSPCHQALVILAGTLRGSVLHPTFLTYLGHLGNGCLQRAQTCMRCLSPNALIPSLCNWRPALPPKHKADVYALSSLDVHWP